MSIEIISISIISINILVYVVLILVWIFIFKPSSQELTSLPKISILIACRNESHNIPTLLKSLQNLNYPKDKLEILIGNDASEDDTLGLLQSYKNIKVYDIRKSIGQLKGKMNVLAHLVQESDGEYLFFTDADMTFNPNILKSLVSNWEHNTGMLVGFSKVEGTNFLSVMQNIDYTIGQGIMKIMTDISNPQYVSGNNMMVSRKAYDATGGYENMTFHLTEDVLLMKGITQQGYQVKAIFEPNSTAKTNAIRNVRDLIQQRKRWMNGFDLMPKSAYIASIIKLLFLPTIIYLLISNPILALFLFTLKLISTVIFLRLINKKVDLKWHNISIIVYDFYELAIYLPALVLYLTTKSTTWKERNF